MDVPFSYADPTHFSTAQAGFLQQSCKRLPAGLTWQEDPGTVFPLSFNLYFIILPLTLNRHKIYLFFINIILIILLLFAAAHAVQAVADPNMGLNIFGLRGIPFNLSAQCGHEHPK